MRRVAISVLVLVCAVGACQSPKKEIVGLWQQNGGNGRVEFFQDGKLQNDPCGEGMTGSWLVLDDGRIKIESSFLGMSKTVMGTIDKGELELVSGSESQRFVKLPPGTPCPRKASSRSEGAGSSSSTSGGDEATRAYRAAMKSDLRNLVTSEESYFADSTKYIPWGPALRFRPSTFVSDPVITVGTGYWAAVVTHSQLPGVQCAIGVNTANPLSTSAGDGEPYCR